VSPAGCLIAVHDISKALQTDMKALTILIHDMLHGSVSNPLILRLPEVVTRSDVAAGDAGYEARGMRITHTHMCSQ
jgi:hypothetical protein